MFFAKDFIETTEGLIFAVVEHGLETGKVLCFLRYVQTESGWQKLSTKQANNLLSQSFPDYLHYSPVKDACLHAVLVERISKIHEPRERLQMLLASTPKDKVERDLRQLCTLYQEAGLDTAQMGVTGSLLAGVHNDDSDIDLVIYDRDQFHQARSLTRKLIQQSRLSSLDKSAWRASFLRRDCQLNEQEYIWHEQRKFNKAVVNGRKFDLNFVDKTEANPGRFTKWGPMTVESTVMDDYYAFDYPAVLMIDHPEIKQIICFTATYTGQAVKGEKIVVSGLVEQSEKGIKRIVVGSSREAKGEYIKVIRAV